MQTRPAENISDRGAQWRGRLVLLLLVIATVLPTIIAVTLARSGWQPQGRNLNHGELYQPPRSFPELALLAVKDGAPAFRSLRGKWLLLTVLDRPCDEHCQKTLYAMQQIRLGQGDHMRRVERALIVDLRQKDELTRLLTEYRGMHGYTADTRSLTALASALLPEGESPIGRLYIVDPVGNLVMRYPLTAEARGVSRDLTRLLRLSRVD